MATIVESDSEAPFSIATTPRSWGIRYSFPWIAPLYPWSVSSNAECQARKHQVPFFKSLVWLDPCLPLLSSCKSTKKKKICKIVDFAVSVDHRIKLKECEKRDKCIDLARQLKKLWNTKVTIIPIVIGAFGKVTKGLLKGLDGFGSWWPSGDHLNNCIIEGGQNTEKSPGDLRRFAVTQSSVKDHQLTLMWKTLMRKKY